MYFKSFSSQFFNETLLEEELGNKSYNVSFILCSADESTL